MSRQFKSLSGQVIVITGATSCIGLSTARMLAKRGAALVLAASHVSTLDRLAGEIRQDGGSVLAVPVDVTALDQVQALGHSAIRYFGRIDTWINAGMAMDDLDDVKPAPVAARLFSAHYWGANHGARVARNLMAQQGGKIINLDSDACARHGVKGLTDTLRADLETDGVPIAVTLVHAAGRNDMHNAPRLVAEAILRAAQHAQRDIVVSGATPMPARGVSTSTPGLLERVREILALRHTHKASHT
ncbi:SDR family NAD(P)-dependent oxidoreductase [Massilia sp. S19_KUP03_FR1]|uniref:SDR family NAD(P)-dependent oxidoreductase n=1 Tax=Massilia sp. S19_KUP03_FR1 TaxID=3025503 RepID=UPI002FCD7C41